MNLKPGLEEEYAGYVEINKDPYSMECVKAGEAVAHELDLGKTGEDALGALMGLGLTGYMATMAVKAVAHFHPQGELVRQAWNKDQGSPELESGIVNPAVLNVDEKGRMTPDVESV